MKTRYSLVSNSSSSSFVVAFPHVPTDSADVWKILFDGRQGGTSSCGDGDGLAYSQISEILFTDLERTNFKAATLQDVVAEFRTRYHYNLNDNTFWFGKRVDTFGGSWYYKEDRYFGSNSKAMLELKKLNIDNRDKTNELETEEKNIEASFGLIPPKYAWKGGMDYSTKIPYTQKEVDEWDQYTKTLEELKKKNKRLQKILDEKRVLWRAFYDAEEKLTTENATYDAANFMDDNEDKFIFIVSYCDNEGNQGSTMEHGNIFRHVPHVVINHH